MQTLTERKDQWRSAVFSLSWWSCRHSQNEKTNEGQQYFHFHGGHADTLRTKRPMKVSSIFIFMVVMQTLTERKDQWRSAVFLFSWWSCRHSQNEKTNEGQQYFHFHGGHADTHRTRRSVKVSSFFYGQSIRSSVDNNVRKWWSVALKIRSARMHPGPWFHTLYVSKRKNVAITSLLFWCCLDSDLNAQQLECGDR